MGYPMLIFASFDTPTARFLHMYYYPLGMICMALKSDIALLQVKIHATGIRISSDLGGETCGGTKRLARAGSSSTSIASCCARVVEVAFVVTF